MSTFDILVDTDAFAGWVMPDDALHERAATLFDFIFSEKLSLVVTSWVIAETATVLSYRIGQNIARQFLHQIETMAFPTIHVSAELQRQTTEVFKAQAGRRISMVDCCNVVVMKEYSIPKIFAFDEFYFKKMGLQSVSAPVGELDTAA